MNRGTHTYTYEEQTACHGMADILGVSLPVLERRPVLTLRLLLPVLVAIALAAAAAVVEPQVAACCLAAMGALRAAKRVGGRRSRPR